jgi:hypothetical protein
MASSFFAPDDDAENEWEEERRRHIRYEMEEEADGDEEWHQWEERVGLRVDDGNARHELEMERVRDEEDDELEELRARHEDDGELGELRARHEEDGEPEELRVAHEEEEVEEDWDVIGITEEVLAFATNIARHPETWLDFPLLPDDDESDGPFSCNFFASFFKLFILILGEMICKVSSLPLEDVLLGSSHFGSTVT